jgi:hypothetical protein
MIVGQCQLWHSAGNVRCASHDSMQVPTVDLHTAIVKKCGPVPQKECFGKPGCFSPHCGGTATHIPGQPTEGYFWLAQSIIQPAIEKLLNA